MHGHDQKKYTVSVPKSNEYTRYVYLNCLINKQNYSTLLLCHAKHKSRRTFKTTKNRLHSNFEEKKIVFFLIYASKFQIWSRKGNFPPAGTQVDA